MSLTDERLSALRHDLRTPLAVILGYADLLAGDREISPETRREYAERIRSAARDLHRTIDDANA
jgi:signal transduction histidine kinase